MDKLLAIKDLESFHTVISNLIEQLYFQKSKLEVEVSADIIELAKSEMKELLVANEFNSQKIRKVLLNRVREDNRIDFVVTVIDKRKTNLVFESILEHNSSAGEVMIDFDWALKLIFGTSQLRTLNHPILELTLNTTERKSIYRSTVYDMKKYVLIKIISLLESM